MTTFILIIGTEETATNTPTPVIDTPENDNSNSSSSDDRRPLLARVDLKRKAEVLSKESGKIGVTITTSSPTSPSPSPAKVCILYIILCYMMPENSFPLYKLI